MDFIAPKFCLCRFLSFSLTANVRDQFNQLMDGQHVNWKSDNPKFATIGVDGTVIGYTMKCNNNCNS
ncbi:hypothetical protein AN642_02360 [Epulopiscium sp. SCG-B10WGA-EpuloA2]|nr:hypothetical protein AN642_02360 [Epulopiscium sp. SCG-B10WGA-EpuloA2]